MLLTAKNVSSQGRAKNTSLVVYSCAGSKKSPNFHGVSFSAIVLFPVVAMFSIKHDSHF